MKDAQSIIKGPFSAQNKLCKNLVADMDRCLENMRDVRTYRSGGNKMLKMNATSHEQQRACSCYSCAGQTAYCNPVQMACMEEVD